MIGALVLFAALTMFAPGGAEKEPPPWQIIHDEKLNEWIIDPDPCEGDSVFVVIYRHLDWSQPIPVIRDDSVRVYGERP